MRACTSCLEDIATESVHTAHTHTHSHTPSLAMEMRWYASRPVRLVHVERITPFDVHLDVQSGTRSLHKRRGDARRAA